MLFAFTLIKSIGVGARGIVWDVEIACVRALEDVLVKGKVYGMNVELGFPPETALWKRIASPVEIMNFPLVKDKIKDIVRLIKLVTAHLPMIDIAATDETERKQNVETQISVIKLAFDLGVKRFILHPAAGKVKYPWFASPAQKAAILKARHEASEKSVREIVDALDNYPIVIAIENLTAKEGDWPINKLNYPFGQHNELFMGICLDTLHEYSNGCTTLKQFADVIERCGNFLVEIHLNNGSGKEKRFSKDIPHMSLIVGSVPVKEIICHLLAKGFLLPVVVEVDSNKDLDTSIELIKRTHASFLFYY